VCVWRTRERVHYRTVDPQEAGALTLATRGECFGALCERLASEVGDGEATARAAALLARWQADGLIAGLPASPPQPSVVKGQAKGVIRDCKRDLPERNTVVTGDVAVEAVSPTKVLTARLAEVPVLVTMPVAVSIVVATMASVASMRAVSLVGPVIVTRSRGVLTVMSVPTVAVMSGASPCAAGCRQ
jgi:hypothetical protein